MIDLFTFDVGDAFQLDGPNGRAGWWRIIGFEIDPATGRRSILRALSFTPPAADGPAHASVSAREILIYRGERPTITALHLWGHRHPIPLPAGRAEPIDPQSTYSTHRIQSEHGTVSVTVEHSTDGTMAVRVAESILSAPWFDPGVLGEVLANAFAQAAFGIDTGNGF